ncbi:hypothetical protein EEL34_13175 [Muribaculaceae bacterium Isolate-039 (Harlan)]|nr:hypothetical protein [Muribaculaceae bacterium S4]ROS84404.1 hypothetical protein EEL34_13175 [Muribaculaceae bacterium Isolate-039 (Harlan)]
MTIKKIMYIIGTGCNIILFVYILICAIIDSYQLWPWGQLMSIWVLIILLIPTSILLRVNYLISIKKDTIKYSILLMTLFIIYSPLYSIRVLRNRWI